MINLLLYERLSQSSTSFIANLTRHTADWMRESRAMGGYWSGGFTITTDTMSSPEMQNFYHTCIGRRIVESTAGIITWEGEITRLEFTRRGVTHTRALDFERWHNRVKVAYTDNSTGDPTATAWAEDTNSSNVYGECEYIDVVTDIYNATSSAAARDRRLTKYAFPRSVPFEFPSVTTSVEDSLRVTCSGYILSMNRRYRESDTAEDNVSTQINTLIGESEFVTAGNIETNTTQATISGSEVSFRLWDGIEELIEIGNTSGADFVGGVYNGRTFDYAQAETDIIYHYDNGRIKQGGAQIYPSLIKPDTVIWNSGISLGITPPGGATIDNPRKAYIEAVEFSMPNNFRLITEEI